MLKREFSIDSIPEGKVKEKQGGVCYIDIINFLNCSTVEGITGIQSGLSAVVSILQ